MSNTAKGLLSTRSSCRYTAFTFGGGRVGPLSGEKGKESVADKSERPHVGGLHRGLDQQSDREEEVPETLGHVGHDGGAGLRGGGQGENRLSRRDA